MEEIPLTAEDRAILALESPTVAGHTCMVVVLGAGAPTTAQLASRVAERCVSARGLRLRLAGERGRPSWAEDEGFDAAAHVLDAPCEQPVDRQGLRAEVARLFAQRLDRSRPLWRIDRVPLDDGGAALVWRIHHALADGLSSMRYARAVLWDDLDAAAPAPGAPDNPAPLPDARDEARRRAHLARFFAREFSRARSPFDGRIGAEREIAFAQLPLDALHDAAKALDDATLNDAVLTVVGGAFGRWIERHHGALGSIRVKVPVSMHHGEQNAGNRDSFFAVEVPLTPADPVARLRVVHAATKVRKAEHDADTMDALLREMRRVSPGLGRLCERVERSPRAFAVNVSNVPGPREQVSVMGASVRSLHSIAEIAEHHAVRVAALSLGDRLFLGFCADPAIVAGVQSMAEASEQEAAELIAAA